MDDYKPDLGRCKATVITSLTSFPIIFMDGGTVGAEMAVVGPECSDSTLTDSLSKLIFTWDHKVFSFEGRWLAAPICFLASNSSAVSLVSSPSLNDTTIMETVKVSNGHEVLAPFCYSLCSCSPTCCIFLVYSDQISMRTKVLHCKSRFKDCCCYTKRRSSDRWETCWIKIQLVDLSFDAIKNLWQDFEYLGRNASIDRVFADAILTYRVPVLLETHRRLDLLAARRRQSSLGWIFFDFFHGVSVAADIVENHPITSVTWVLSPVAREKRHVFIWGSQKWHVMLQIFHLPRSYTRRLNLSNDFTRLYGVRFYGVHLKEGELI